MFFQQDLIEMSSYGFKGSAMWWLCGVIEHGITWTNVWYEVKWRHNASLG